MMLAPNLQTNQTLSEHIYGSFEQMPGDLMEVTYYYENGAVRQTGFIKDELLTGTWITYDEKGNLTAKAYYEEGKKTGTWKVYDATGNLVYKITYKNGIKKAVRIFDENGADINMAMK